jgi:hypothetical protein
VFPPEHDLTPSFFLTLCLGGILCLTPLAVYLFWLSSLNRKPRPSVVATTWEFAAMLVGLAGFLFATGVLLASVIVDTLLYSKGPLARFAAWLPIEAAWGIPLTFYVFILVRLISRGLRARRQALSIFNVDAEMLESVIDELLMLANCPATRAGNSWVAGPNTVVQITVFPVFQHVTVRLVAADAALRETLENSLRTAVPKLPAARDNPAASWISAASTCCIVTVACCVAIVFAMPFLK